MATFNFTTGPSTLPDVGELSYNNCVFSPLFETQVSSVFIKDAANRTTKEIEYTITADGYVTLPAGHANIEVTMSALERLLSAPGGVLKYSQRSLGIVINSQGGDRDTAWGPLPEILDITPMGNGGSAKIKWTVKTRIPPRVTPGTSIRSGPILQFCYDTSVSYDEAGYSTLRYSGIVEIPMTRRSVNDRTVPRTADDFRRRFPGDLLATIDLKKFRVTQREFKISKDKRIMEFNVAAEELPWMSLPPDVTVARGSFTFRPAKAGIGLCNWLCTLTCTYTVPKGRARRIAWFAFLALLRVRMQEGNINGIIPPPNGNQNPGAAARNIINIAINPIILQPDAVQGAGEGAWGAAGGHVIDFFRDLFRRPVAAAAPPPLRLQRKVWLIDLNGNEGLYLDSKTVTFSATWRLITVFDAILKASGLWKKVPNLDENTWATSVRNISGYTSWERNPVEGDVIVDFGT